MFKCKNKEIKHRYLRTNNAMLQNKTRFKIGSMVPVSLFFTRIYPKSFAKSNETTRNNLSVTYRVSYAKKRQARRSTHS